MEKIKTLTPDEKKLKRLRENLQENAEMMEVLNLALTDIWEQVAIFLADNYGEEKWQEKMDHFDESWVKMYEKYGNDLIIALGEQTDDINFVNHEGYIDKHEADELVSDVRKRRRRLNSREAFQDAS